MNDEERVFNKRMVEFLNYLNLEDSSFPTMQNDVYFSDSSSMAHFFYYNTKIIEHWINRNLFLNGIDYGRARDMLFKRIDLVSKNRELSLKRFHKKTLQRSIKQDLSYLEFIL